LAEVISRVIQAVSGDLIPVTQSYNMAMDFFPSSLLNQWGVFYADFSEQIWIYASTGRRSVIDSVT
jgi:hypothetical protein